jgi:hypothetical protein
VHTTSGCRKNPATARVSRAEARTQSSSADQESSMKQHSLGSKGASEGVEHQPIGSRRSHQSHGAAGAAVLGRCADATCGPRQSEALN